MCEVKPYKGKVCQREVQHMTESDSKRKREGKYKERCVSSKVCVEERRVHAREQESEINRRKMLEGVQGSVSAQGRQGKSPLGKEKHMQQESLPESGKACPGERQSTFRRAGKHV